MPRDARRDPPSGLLEADLCIVGAGAAGITLARALAGSPWRVLLLEAGGFEFDEADHALLAGELGGVPTFPLESSRLRLFGGTTNHWSGTCWPLDPIDFEAREGLPRSGWPFRRADLDPYYARAHEVCGLGPYDYAPGHWAEATGQPLLPFDASRVPTRIQQIQAARFGFAYREELEKAPNVEIVVHADVLELLHDGRRVQGLRASPGAGGSPFRVEARHVVLAAGGLENARILLLSGGPGSPGLGNAHDLVGRHFMDHLIMPVAVLLPTDPELSFGLYHRQSVGDIQVNGCLALAEEVVRSEGLLNFAASLRPFRGTPDEREAMLAAESEGVVAAKELARSLGKGRMPDQLARQLLDVLGDLDGLARAAWQEARGRRPTLSPDVGQVYLISHGEQSANPESRVRLAASRDALGRPRTRLDWRLSPLDQRTLRRGAEIVAREAGRLGLGRVQVLVDKGDDFATWSGRSPWLGPIGAYHHLGTTRMAADPAQGVVDADCRVHELDNLWIAGSSVFPTGGYVNPTLTLVALALRLADRLREVLG